MGTLRTSRPHDFLGCAFVTHTTPLYHTLWLSTAGAWGLESSPRRQLDEMVEMAAADVRGLPPKSHSSSDFEHSSL